MDDARAKLSRFLSERRVKKGEPFTHTSKTNPSASYYVGEESQNNFLALYCNLVKRGGVMSLTEKPGAYGPLRVDFDMKATLDVGLERQFSQERVTEVIGYYQTEIRLAIPSEEFEEKMVECILLEKSGPRVDEGKIKDGFHLHFPHFICEGWIMDEYLRGKVIEKMVENKTWDKCKFTEAQEKIIDAPMAKKQWLMYGSSKSDGAEPFLISKAYSINMEEIELDDVFENEMIGRPNALEFYLPRLMSIRGYNECTILRKDLEARCAAMKNKKARKTNVKRKRTVEEVMEDIKTITDGGIMDMLSADRADEFNSWMDVGWVLFNVTQGIDEGLQLWIDFSKKSSKFVDGECEERWSKMDLRDKTIGSLFSMAKVDSPDKYKEWKETQLKTFLYHSLYEEKPNEWDIGQVVLKLYGDRFKCADAKKDLWYEFKCHRWQYVDDNVSMKKLLATEVKQLYVALIAKISADAVGKGELEEEKAKKNRYRCDAIITSLKTCMFQDKLIRMCKVVFHDPLFIKKIDENRLLFCCENGVLDLELGVFRDGRPDDYITMCCNVPYRKFNDEDDEIIEIMEFLRKVFPDEELLNYFLDHSCSCMEGGNVNKTFVVGTGSGDNGKTVTFSLLEVTFGEYCMKFPRELFVMGKGNSSSGPRPELSRVRGKRLAMIQEIAKTETLNIGILKELTGNDSFFARGMYEKGTEISPMFTLMLQCLTGDTLIRLPSGESVPIKKLAGNDSVMAWDPVTEKLKEVRQLAFLDQGQKSCVLLKFEDGREITCTPNHRFLTGEKTWIYAQDIVLGVTDIMTENLKGIKVLSREDAGLHQVYDLTIETPYSNFIANGMVSHNCNEPPHVPGHDEATWNRIRVLDFKSKFVLPKHRAKYPVPDDPAEQMKMKRFKADMGLKKKLPDMAMALLCVLFERFKDYKKRGLREPQEVMLSTDTYRAMNDVYLQFIRDRVEQLTYPVDTPEKQKCFLKLPDLHQEFTAWYQENNTSYARERFNKNTLMHEFNKRFGPCEKMGRICGWYGFKIVDDVESETTDEKQKALANALTTKAKTKAKENVEKKFKDVTPKPKSVGKKDVSKSDDSIKPKSVGKKDVSKSDDSIKPKSVGKKDVMILTEPKSKTAKKVK